MRENGAERRRREEGERWGAREREESRKSEGMCETTMEMGCTQQHRDKLTIKRTILNGMPRSWRHLNVHLHRTFLRNSLIKFVCRVPTASPTEICVPKNGAKKRSQGTCACLATWFARDKPTWSTWLGSTFDDVNQNNIRANRSSIHVAKITCQQCLFLHKGASILIDR